METVEYCCRDEILVAAPPEPCFDLLADLATYARWWTLVRVIPERPSTLLTPGARFAFSGARPGGERVDWKADVLQVERPLRIELAYAGGEYLGRTAWELEPGDGGTRVAYLYRGVRPNTPRAAAHFERWGTRLHSVAMREDALAGLARALGGPGAGMDDAAWQADVRRRVAEGIQRLESP